MEQGLSLFGVADISGIKKDFNMNQKTFAGYKYAISMGKQLLDSVLDQLEDKPDLIYFHHYRQTNFFLDRSAFLISSFIQESGYRALPIAASQTVDWEKQKAHLSHKKIGRLAGLGWIGRNNLLVNPVLGARFRLVSILTDMPLKEDKPLEENCGFCRDCLPVCPANAIKESRTDFDHWACFDKLREFRRKGYVGQYICGICVKACSGKKESNL